MERVELTSLKLPSRFLRKLEQDIHLLMEYKSLQIEKIILFGSCARLKPKVTSDLDLLVVTKERVDRYIRGDIASEFDEPLDGVTTDVVFYQTEVYETSDSLLMKQIRKDGIILYEKEEQHES